MKYLTGGINLKRFQRWMPERELVLCEQDIISLCFFHEVEVRSSPGRVEG
jgi:hypothetical protein